jgi:tetraacyldisaccharide 4'-kinase
VIRYLESVVYKKRRDPIAVVVRCILVLLSKVYGALLWLYLLLFAIGLLKRQRLSCPVISVGNITVGGTGKTPTVQYVCQEFVKAERKPAILSYGYRGKLKGRFGLVSDGKSVLLTPDVAGDEPVMLAASLPGVPVLVGKDRAVTGRAAVADLSADVLVLDDGFQVWKLYKDIEIVLLSAVSPFDNGRLLPAGRLREPPSALRRADCILVIGKSDESMRRSLIGQIQIVAGLKPIFWGEFVPTSFVCLGSNSVVQIESLRGVKVLAVSGVANPDSFETALGEIGAVIVGTKRFPDHHIYSESDVQVIERIFSQTGAEWVVTTTKDVVKLQRLKVDVPILSPQIELKLENESAFWSLINDKIGCVAKRQKCV